SEILPAAFWLGVAADHTVDGLRDFYLQPLPAAALFIAAVGALGENSFQTFLFCDFKQRSACAGIVVGIARQIVGNDDSLKHFLAFFQIDPVQIVSIHVDQVEYVVDDWNITIGSGTFSVAAQPGALLHQAER